MTGMTMSLPTSMQDDKTMDSQCSQMPSPAHQSLIGIRIKGTCDRNNRLSASCARLGNQSDNTDSCAKRNEALVLEALILPVETGLCWVEGRELACTQFELRAGEDAVAGLRFSDAAGFVAIGESASGAWILTDEGLIGPRISVRSAADQVVLAVYKPKLLGLPGILEFFDGRKFYWRRLGLFSAAYRFDDAEGKPLIVVRCKCSRSWLFGPRVFRGFVEVEPDAGVMSELMPLLLLSWYLILLQRNDARFLLIPCGTSGLTG